jgi:uncharacterized protein (DUF983 family)
VGQENGVMLRLRFLLVWAPLGALAFCVIAVGFPLLFLVLFRDWSPTIPHPWLRLLIYAPGNVLGLLAWVTVARVGYNRYQAALARRG